MPNFARYCAFLRLFTYVCNIFARIPSYLHFLYIIYVYAHFLPGLHFFEKKFGKYLHNSKISRKFANRKSNH